MTTNNTVSMEVVGACARCRRSRGSPRAWPTPSRSRRHAPGPRPCEAAAAGLLRSHSAVRLHLAPREAVAAACSSSSLRLRLALAKPPPPPCLMVMSRVTNECIGVWQCGVPGGCIDGLKSALMLLVGRRWAGGLAREFAGRG